MKFTYTLGDEPLAGYTIKRGVGHGGFGEVYFAVSEGGKEVALKHVQRHMEVELRGVRQCLNLRHPNLVLIHDVKQSAEGDCWIVMEYMAGERLSDAIARHPQGMPVEQAVHLLREICLAVSHLHSRGIVHRDLKPSNIFLEQDSIKLGDYGLSKFISSSRHSTQTESVGTVHYVSPEVAHGKYGKEIDIYALGIIFFEMLAGEVPFRGESVGEILMKHLTAMPDLERVPPGCRAVLSKALAKDPAKRFSTADEMIQGLNEICPSGEEDCVPIARPADPQPSVDVKARVLFELGRAGRSLQDLFSQVGGALVEITSSQQTKLGIARLFIILILGLGLGLVVSGFVLGTGIGLYRQGLHDDVAAMLGLAAGCLTVGYLIRQSVMQLIGRRSFLASLITGTFASVLLGLGIGFALGGIMMPVAEEEVAAFLAIGFGLVACTASLAIIVRAARRAIPPQSSVSPWLVLTRLLVGVPICAGGAFIIGALGMHWTRQEEVAILLAAGIGLIVWSRSAGSLVHCYRGRTSVFATWLLAALSTLSLAFGFAFLAAGVTFFLGGHRADEEAAFAGLGSGLLVAGVAMSRYVRLANYFPRAGTTLFRLFAALIVSSGVGIACAAGLFAITDWRADEEAAVFGIGAGLLAFGLIMARTMISPSATPSATPGSVQHADLASPTHP